MDKIKLVKPSNVYADDIMKYRQEFLDIEDSLDGCGNLRSCQSAKEWINTLNLLENEETCPKDRVPSDTYLAIRLSDNKIVGVIDFRHHIHHPILSVWGGHIGYSVRPDERRKGYAKEMLRLNLENCQAFGLDKVLITCDNHNIASEKTILANGGKFEKIVVVDGDEIKRYWIDISAKETSPKKETLIRKIELTDYEKVDLLMQQLHKEHVIGRPDLYVDMEHPYSKKEFEQLIGNEHVIALLAEEENRALGICFVSMKDKSGMIKMKTAYMDDLVVDQNYRNQGIAKRLFKEAERIAIEKGAKRLDLMVWSFNEKAIKLYESLGMKPQRFIYEKPL